MSAYHVSHPDDREAIRRHGLDAERYGDNDYSGNWLWLTLADAKRFAGDNDIWAVNTGSLDVSIETLIYAGEVRVAGNVLDPISPGLLRLESAEPPASDPRPDPRTHPEYWTE